MSEVQKKRRICKICSPHTSLCNLQQLNLHIFAKHKGLDVRRLEGMVPDTTVCTLPGCLMPIYCPSAHTLHFNSNHSGLTIPPNPVLEPSIGKRLARQRAERVSSTFNENVNNISNVTNAQSQSLNGNTVSTTVRPTRRYPNPADVLRTEVRSIVSSSTSSSNVANTINLGSEELLTPTASSGMSEVVSNGNTNTGIINNGIINNNSNAEVSEENGNNNQDITPTAVVPRGRRRSARNTSRNSTVPATPSNAALTLSQTSNSSSVPATPTSNIPTNTNDEVTTTNVSQVSSSSEQVIVPAPIVANNVEANNGTQVTTNTRRRSRSNNRTNNGSRPRRNSSLVAVRHPDLNAVNNDEDDVSSFNNNGLLDGHDDMFVTTRNVLRGACYEYLPLSIEDINIPDDFIDLLDELNDDEFEEKFFSFNHLRLQSLHYSYVPYLRGIFIKILKILNNMDENIYSIKFKRSTIVAFHCLIMVIRVLIMNRKARRTADGPIDYLKKWFNMEDDKSMIGSILFVSLMCKDFIVNTPEFTIRSDNSGKENVDRDRIIKRINKLMTETKFSKALQLAENKQHVLNSIDMTGDAREPNRQAMTINNTTPMSSLSAEEINILTRQLHPTGHIIDDDVYDFMDDDDNDAVIRNNVNRVQGLINSTTILDDDIVCAIKSLNPISAEGVDSWNYFHLKKLFLYSEKNHHGNGNGDNGAILEELHLLLKQFLNGSFANPKFWVLSRLIYFRKPNGGARPLAIGSSLYRLIMKIIVNKISPATGTLLAPIQVGVSIKDGGSILASQFMRMYDVDSSIAFLNYDLENAFNTEKRRRTARGVAKHCPVGLKLYQHLYNSNVISSLRGANGKLLGVSETGVRQGDPGSMLWYCCSIQDTLMNINQECKAKLADLLLANNNNRNDGDDDDVAELSNNINHRHANANSLYVQGSYADDLTQAVNIKYANEIFLFTMELFHRHGFIVNTNKCFVLVNRQHQNNQELLDRYFPDDSYVKFQAKILGIMIGDNNDKQRFYSSIKNEIHRLALLMKSLPAYISFYLIKYCINAMPVYASRIYHPDIITNEADNIDNIITQSICHILQLQEIPVLSMPFLSLPGKLAGLGLHRFNSFFSKILFDTLEQRVLHWCNNHGCDRIKSIIQNSLSNFDLFELGFKDNIRNDSVSSNARLHIRYQQVYDAMINDFRASNRFDFVNHMHHNTFSGSGELFGISYIRNSFTSNPAFLAECIAHRLKIPIIPPPTEFMIPPPSEYNNYNNNFGINHQVLPIVSCTHCDRLGKNYHPLSYNFEHALVCGVSSHDIITRHNNISDACQKYVKSTIVGENVTIDLGTSANTAGDQGQTCDFVVNRNGRTTKFDVKVCYYDGDAFHNHTNNIAPINSIINTENEKRAHYQRNDNSPGDVIPLVVSSSGFYLGPSFIAFCNAVESGDGSINFDYGAINGVKFERKAHASRRRLISEIIRFCYVFIAKARIRARQQLYYKLPILSRPPSPQEVAARMMMMQGDILNGNGVM